MEIGEVYDVCHVRQIERPPVPFWNRFQALEDENNSVPPPGLLSKKEEGEVFAKVDIRSSYKSCIKCSRTDTCKHKFAGGRFSKVNCRCWERCQQLRKMRTLSGSNR